MRHLWHVDGCLVRGFMCLVGLKASRVGEVEPHGSAAVAVSICYRRRSAKQRDSMHHSEAVCEDPVIAPSNGLPLLWGF